MTKFELTLMAFVKSIDEELSVTFKNDGYYFVSADNSVNIDLTDFEDYGFMRHLVEVHKCEWATEFNLHLWSILHEIGHYETEDEICEEDGEEEIRYWLSLTDKDMAKDTNIQNGYFNLTSEYFATEWAIEWIENNYEHAKKINDIICNNRKG
jgi:hypothetical protein